jgi:hypothetical protein
MGSDSIVASMSSRATTPESEIPVLDARESSVDAHGLPADRRILSRECSISTDHSFARLADILDLFAEDSWRRVYAGECEVRPPAAPTIGPGGGPIGRR